MNIHKQVAVTALLLMLFAITGAALVGLTHDSTLDKIKDNERRTLLRTLNTILPAHEYDNDLVSDSFKTKPDILLGTTEATIVYRARKQNTSVAVILSPVAPNGYNGPIHLLVGIYHNGTIAGVRVIKHRETPGLGDVIESSRSDWILGFQKKSLNNPENKQWKVKRDGGEFDQFTGATITPRAVVKSVHSALLYFSHHRDELFETAHQKTVTANGN